MPVAVVSGASGFIGGHLCARLVQDGYEVRPLQRATYQSGILDISEACRSLEGADVVYHLAGIAHERHASDRERYDQINGRLPADLALAATQSGVGAFVWLSTIKVLGDVSAEPLRVDAPYRPHDRYAMSKVMAEQAIAQHQGNLRIATVRPPLVYGPGVRGNFASLLQSVQRGWPIPLKGANAPRSMVAVGNLTDLLVRLASDGSGVFHVGDAQDMTLTTLYSNLCAKMNRPDRQFFLPHTFIQGVLTMVGKRSFASRLFDPLRVDWQATRSMLDWVPPMTIEEELTRVVACYQQRV